MPPAIPFITRERLADPRLMALAIDAIGPAFASLTGGGLQAPDRTLIQTGAAPPLRQLLVSPVAWPDRARATVKVTTLTPANPARGLALIQGLVLLLDLETGQPRAMLEGGGLTALRTGATAGYAAQRLSAPGAADLAVIGAGVQARALIDAMLTVRPIRTVHLASRGRSGLDRLADWVASRWGRRVDVRVHDDVGAAVAGADILCTATSTEDPTPLVTPGMARPGTFYAVIGGATEHACEIAPDLLRGARVVVETVDGALAEAGEIRAALARGFLHAADLLDLPTLATAPHPPPADRPATIFRSVGHAAEDLAVADAVFEAMGGEGGGPL
ncbi:ornithine cyclodeaminase family protein [Niveispirillum fermenti]|uniref:ornithine cyclodeaminase family protein n=1 Tax=Niveispirillum fermenti TaxID=1233113 RepID=UPI003A85AADA